MSWVKVRFRAKQINNTFDKIRLNLGIKLPVSNLEQIEADILALTSKDFEKLRQWFFDLDYERWDEQLEQDIEDGKLEALAEEAIAEFKEGNCREI